MTMSPLGEFMSTVVTGMPQPHCLHHIQLYPTSCSATEQEVEMLKLLAARFVGLWDVCEQAAGFLATEDVQFC